MINYDLPKSVTVDGTEYAIRDGGDFRLVLDIISALNDDELSDQWKYYVCLSLFYETIPKDTKTAITAMFDFINLGKSAEAEQKEEKMMDWEQDFPILIPAINKALGCEVRAVSYMHWWTFVSGYQGIDGDNIFSTVVRIRWKRQHGEKLERDEQKFLSENRDIVLIKSKISREDEEFLLGVD